jgi:hypothetical protein
MLIVSAYTVTLTPDINQINASVEVGGLGIASNCRPLRYLLNKHLISQISTQVLGKCIPVFIVIATA